MAINASKPTLFAGEFRHGIDPKNRITIPVSWRGDEEGSLFYLRIDTSRDFLLVLSLEECERVKQEAAAKLADQQKLQSFYRAFLGVAKECRADKQGRMVLPPELCKQAGLEGEAVLVGTGGRFELWNTERWEARKQAEAADYENLAVQLGL